VARYRKAAHSRYTIFYHLVFLPRFRQKVLTNLEIDKELKAIIKKMAPFHDWVIREIETDRDHIHILLSAPPRYSPSEIVKLIKTWTQKRLFEKYPKKVKQYLWGGRFWCQGFYVSTVSDRTTSEEIKKYIRKQKAELKQLGLFPSTKTRKT
jgi:putative transposase